MANNEDSNLTDDQNYCQLLSGVADLQSSACDINIERQTKETSISLEEHDKSIHDDKNEEENLKIIKQTTDIARHAMILLVRGIQLLAIHASHKSKCFSSFSSAISFLREQEGVYEVPKHLLLQWERNVGLIDLFTSDEGLYCNKRIAQDMFDVCMETFDWLRSLANNNK
ncbi:unnamed protein product [Adineta steineri]|uniref:Uncharacterized protein n=1 Tax=Adineta steineri TaxID=433720 RepID=A0A814VTE2_9BILA|nr:unnamed protein product [Adineta steineri]